MDKEKHIGYIDKELAEMINKFDTVPAPELQLDINEYMRIYSYLKELQLYHQIYGLFKDYKLKMKLT